MALGVRVPRYLFPDWGVKGRRGLGAVVSPGVAGLPLDWGVPERWGGTDAAGGGESSDLVNNLILHDIICYVTGQRSNREPKFSNPGQVVRSLLK